MRNPKFITLEGIDKTGKTLIWDILKTDFPKYTFITDPPKWDPWDSIFTNGTLYDKLPSISESFILLSARLHSYTEKIKISLEKDISVISDRYADSWLAYQAVFNRNYFSDDTASLDFFKRIHDVCIEYGTLINPDITILITADIGIIKKRLKVTENITKYEEDIENLKEVQSNYLKLAK
jgi:thymidylate kinase